MSWSEPPEGIDDEYGPPPGDAYTLSAFEGDAPISEEGCEFIVDTVSPPWWLRWLGLKIRVRLWFAEGGWHTVAWFRNSHLAMEFAHSLARSIVRAKNAQARQSKD